MNIYTIFVYFHNPKNKAFYSIRKTVHYRQESCKHYSLKSSLITLNALHSARVYKWRFSAFCKTDSGSLEEYSVLKRAEPLAAVIIHLISSVPQASVNGNVVQHITTVLEPGAGNYTGI